MLMISACNVALVCVKVIIIFKAVSLPAQITSTMFTNGQIFYAKEQIGTIPEDIGQ